MTTRIPRLFGLIAATGVLSAGAPTEVAHGSPSPLQASEARVRLTLQRLVDPATRVEMQGRLIRFSLLAHIRFDTLNDLFAHIDAEAGHWRFDSPASREAFANSLMRRGVQSRVMSMETEVPLELILTHTQEELAGAVDRVVPSGAPVFKGRHWQLTRDAYRDAFLRVRDRWSTSINCWSASSSIAGRVLSNWYIVDEGITLYGTPYDSTEHFWQAVKYHPDVTVADVRGLLTAAAAIDWRPWLSRLRSDQAFYFANAYAVEFLDHNLTRERLAWYEAELARVARPDERARTAQQRTERAAGAPPRFTPLDEKVVWGDVADLFHLIVSFSSGPGASDDAALAVLRGSLEAAHFDAVYLAGYAGGRFAFLSPEFQALMLEIWKVKFIQTPRLNAVIRSTSGVRLDHFLDDGDSPDIPIPVYVGYLNRIRDIAMETKR